MPILGYGEPWLGFQDFLAHFWHWVDLEKNGTLGLRPTFWRPIMMVLLLESYDHNQGFRQS